MFKWKWSRFSMWKSKFCKKMHNLINKIPKKIRKRAKSKSVIVQIVRKADAMRRCQSVTLPNLQISSRVNDVTFLPLPPDGSVTLYTRGNFVTDRDVYRTQNGDVVSLTTDGTLRMLNQRGGCGPDMIWDSCWFGLFFLKIWNSGFTSFILHLASHLQNLAQFWC